MCLYKTRRSIDQSFETDTQSRWCVMGHDRALRAMGFQRKVGFPYSQGKESLSRGGAFRQRE